MVKPSCSLTIRAYWGHHNEKAAVHLADLLRVSCGRGTEHPPIWGRRPPRSPSPRRDTGFLGSRVGRIGLTMLTWGSVLARARMPQSAGQVKVRETIRPKASKQDITRIIQLALERSKTATLTVFLLVNG
jgi:hypothetical protein